MKKFPTIFLKTAIVIIGLATLAMMIRFPMTEGRAASLSVLEIYADPFIIYVYLSSIAFFVALYQAFKLLRLIGEDKTFTLGSVKSLRTIRHCAKVLGVLIVLAATYIRLFHAQEDDPAGFIALSIVATFICIVVGSAAATLERILQKGIDISEKKSNI
jgi:hypothetical protein